MIRGALAIIEPVEVGANEVAKTRWVCTAGHFGIVRTGYPIFCPQCCHGERVPAGFTCSRCGERGRDD